MMIFHSLLKTACIFSLSLVFCTLPLKTEAVDPFLEKREAMIENQIKARGVKDPQVLQSMLEVKRHLFVPERVKDSAYEDYPLPIGQGQTISQPYIVAYMTEALELKREDCVLEIGTGSGYQAAILAEIASNVYSIEIIEELAKNAQKRLEALGYANITVTCGDGYKGWPEYAPFDAIIATAAPPEIPQELIKQLKIGGRMVVPTGSFFQELQLVTKTETGVKIKNLLPVRFVPMVHPKH